MASETRCTITVDEEHDPPRWLRVDGLQLFDLWNQAPAKVGFVFGVIIAIPLILLWAYAPNWLSSPPWWKTYLAAIILGSAVGLAFTLRGRFLRRIDIRGLREMPDDEMAIHRQAVLSLFYISDRMRSRWLWRVDAAAFCNTYQSREVRPPSAVLYGMDLNNAQNENTELPKRITGDSPMRLRSKWEKNWMKLVFWGLLIFSSIALAGLLIPSNRASVSWQAIFAMSTTFLSSVFFTYQLSFAASRKHVLIDRGHIEFSKWFKRRTLSSDDALCVVTSMLGMVTLQWHRPGHAWPAQTLYFHDPNDPRLATILSLWTADPLPDNSA